MARLLFFSIGIILAGYVPELPSFLFIFLLLAAAFLIALLSHKRFAISWSVFALVVGLAYGLIAGHNLLAIQISDKFVERDVIVEGRVVDLPQLNNRRQLFTFKVSKAYSAYAPESLFEPFPGKVLVSSYGELRVKTGEYWKLTLKLKKPRGFVNPGGFDYQAYLLRRGIGATGYIRQGNNQLMQAQPAGSLDVLRYELQQWLINTSNSPEKGILVALLVGDTSLVDKSRWEEMIKTGTNHLIAISGLHLGFFAIVGFFIGNTLGRFVQVFCHRCPSMVSGYVCSIGFSLFYSLIAGFNIPTIRTLIMLATVQLALLFRRSFRGCDSLLVALVLVLLYDPLASYDIGFWLSFCAVAMLIFCFSGRIPPTIQSGLRQTIRQHFTVFLKSQWVMFVGLLIPLSVLINTSSLLAPLANFIAIPVITFFVVPCLIVSALCHYSLTGAETFFLGCAEWGMSGVHHWLKYLLYAGQDKFNPLVNLNPWAIPLALLGTLLMLLPRGLGNKYVAGGILIFSLIIPLKHLPDLQLLVFDVGQGTAILIRTPHHQLLYDTGPVYTENFDAGSGIIVPYLKSQGLQILDTLVVSHNDQDHSGGLPGVLAAVDVANLWLGEPDKYRPDKWSPVVENCHEQLPWRWDQVSFQFIHWPISASAKANNHSCVLLIEYRGQKILLTGDIEKQVEQILLAQEQLTNVNILLAPHHGSHTSSTPGFVAHLHPQYVIYSAGFHNQHGHPHKDVQERYRAQGAQPLNTAYSGAIEFNWDNSGGPTIRQYRQFSKRYWFDLADLP